MLITRNCNYPLSIVTQFLLLILFSVVLVESNQKCDTNVVVVICKPQESEKTNVFKNNYTILPEHLGLRHLNTLKLDAKFNRQIQQTIVLIKSIIISTKFAFKSPTVSVHPFLYPKSNPCVNFIIVGKNSEVIEEIENEIDNENWDPDFRSIVRLTFVGAKYPPGMEWMERVYKSCATLRLFLPEILKDYKQIIYVDTDIIFLRSPLKLQERFKKVSSQQLAGITPELGIRSDAIKQSFYDPQAYNTGVMLMDLQKMRSTGWSSKVAIVAKFVLEESFYGDQDVFIIYFKINSHELMDLPCHWNYLPKYCIINCAHAEGISLVHGVGGSFFLSPGSPYETLFRFYQQYPIDSKFSINEFNKKLGDKLWTLIQGLNNPTKYCGRPLNSTVFSDITFTEIIVKAMEELN